jgi:hypothetical protein
MPKNLHKLFSRLASELSLAVEDGSDGGVTTNQLVSAVSEIPQDILIELQVERPVIASFCVSVSVNSRLVH